MSNAQNFPTAQPVASAKEITNQPSNVHQVDSKLTLYPSLNALAECEGVCLTMSDNAPNIILISSAETGERLFNATYEDRLDAVGRVNTVYARPVRPTETIELFDYAGHQILTTTWNRWKRADCLLLQQYHIYAGNGASEEEIGTFIEKDCNCSHPKYYVSAEGEGKAKFDFLSDGCCRCCCCRINCCPCTISSFKILQTTPNGQIRTRVGEMIAGLPEDPDAFGINFHKSLSVVDKTLLLVSGMILNILHHAQPKCCDSRWHVGKRGCTCINCWMLLFLFLLTGVVAGVIAWFTGKPGGGSDTPPSTPIVNRIG